MKFGKRLRDLLEDSLPEWKNKFLAYKELKKKLKSLPQGDVPCPAADESTQAEVAPQKEGECNYMNQEVFVKLLNEELEKFNCFFMEKEEEFVIRMQVLREEVERVRSLCPNGELAHCHGCENEVTDLRKAVVSLHGEMVLLENYSALNYTGLVKILKKHDKRTGLILRHPFISTVLRQPFLTTEILSKLVKECEQSLQCLFPTYSSAGSQVDDQSDFRGNRGEGCCDSPPSSPDSANMQAESVVDEEVEAVYRSTLTALRSLQEIRGSSKTPHPLLAEAASMQGLSFQKLKDVESKAIASRPHCSASSSAGNQCCSAPNQADAVNRGCGQASARMISGDGKCADGQGQQDDSQNVAGKDSTAHDKRRPGGDVPHSPKCSQEGSQDNPADSPKKKRLKTSDAEPTDVCNSSKVDCSCH